jgi:hypothetical protein
MRAFGTIPHDALAGPLILPLAMAFSGASLGRPRGGNS